MTSILAETRRACFMEHCCSDLLHKITNCHLTSTSTIRGGGSTSGRRWDVLECFNKNRKTRFSSIGSIYPVSRSIPQSGDRWLNPPSIYLSIYLSIYPSIHLRIPMQWVVVLLSHSLCYNLCEGHVYSCIAVKQRHCFPLRKIQQSNVLIFFLGWRRRWLALCFASVLVLILSNKNQQNHFIDTNKVQRKGNVTRDKEKKKSRKSETNFTAK